MFKRRCQQKPMSHVCLTNVFYLVHIMFQILNELPAFKNWEICMKILESWMIWQHWSFLHDSSHLAHPDGPSFSSFHYTPFLMSSGCERQSQAPSFIAFVPLIFSYENCCSEHNLTTRSFWFLEAFAFILYIVGNTMH